VGDMTRPPFVSGLLLAAGLSSRFRGVKQLAELDGVALVERGALALRESEVDEVVVVLGYAAGEVRKRLDERKVNVVVNPGYKGGMSSSLRVGVDSLDRRSAAVVVCLADQPFVTSVLIDRIISRFRETGADCVAAASGSVVAPPVLISKDLYGLLRGLKGDKGAKAILMSRPDFERVEVDPAALLDIDTEEELSRAENGLPPTARKRAPAGDGPSRSRPSSKK
jgi:molybdenum cofactor cytidylyltransferase